MDKHAIKGVKKILSLVKTKIRLAEEYGTVCVKPKPLRLVELLSRVRIETVVEAKDYLLELKRNLDLENPKSVSDTVLQSLDIIEGVKYEFESGSFHLDDEALSEIEAQAKVRNTHVTLLLMTRGILQNGGINLFVGEDKPEGSILVGEVPSTISFFMSHALKSDYFSKNMRLVKVNSILGGRSLILNAIHYSLGEYGAALMTEVQ